MNTPEVDRASVALHNQLMAKVRSDAEREMEKQMQSVPAKERRKLKSLLSNIKFVGDVGKAAGKARVSRKLLDKWMRTPGVSWHINTAFNEAQGLSHSAETASDLLFRAKIAPQLKADGEVFRATGQRKRESRVVAKLAAQNLQAYRWHIAQAANNSDKQFFIDLGKILTGEISGAFCDKINTALIEIYAKQPTANTRQIITALNKRGLNDIEEGAIRVRKSRLGLTQKRDRK